MAGSVATGEGSEVTSEGSEVTSEGSEVTSEGSEVTSEGSEVTSEGTAVVSEGSEVTSNVSGDASALGLVFASGGAADSALCSLLSVSTVSMATGCTGLSCDSCCVLFAESAESSGRGLSSVLFADSALCKEAFSSSCLTLNSSGQTGSLFRQAFPSCSLRSLVILEDAS